MRFSFIILTWNSEKYITNCLDSIVSTLDSDQHSYEIFVVDNFSADNTRRILAEYENKLPGLLQTEYLHRNSGTTVSRNLALKKVKGEFVVILDSDVILKPDTITSLVLVLAKDKTIGLVAPKLIYPDGRIQKSTDKFPTLLSKIKRFFFLKDMEKSLRIPEKTTDIDYAISAVWMFRKELLSQIGFLDENIFYAPEDADYCLSCWKSGLRVVYVPDAVAVHDAPENSRGFSLNKSKLNHIKGLLYFFKKHQFLFSSPKFIESSYGVS